MRWTEGINPETASIAVEAGARVLVAGVGGVQRAGVGGGGYHTPTTQRGTILTVIAQVLVDNYRQLFNASEARQLLVFSIAGYNKVGLIG